MGIIQDRQDFMRRLMQSGAYTEIQASVLADALDAAFAQPATRNDLLELRAESREEFGRGREESVKARAETQADFARVRADSSDEFAKVRAEAKDESAKLRQEISTLATRVEVLGERVERIADRTLSRGTAVMIVLFGAFFGALRLWPPG